ncbi:MAG: hypothetical protein GDA53_04220 [Rhodobacteraceae bacterium]|nr:hypothetical protein [Paracoccaceae bacterium]
MALRKQAAYRAGVRDDLQRLIRASRTHRVTEEDLREQRISFAFGNAMNIGNVTKETVRTTSQRVRLKD